MALASLSSLSSPLLLLAGAIPAYLASLVVYRRYFHPLKDVPGPFLPAVSRLYLWYWSVVQEGQFHKKIEEMHQKYGPIIRIAPNEVHLSNPDDYEKIFSVGGEFYKDPQFYATMGPNIMFTCVSNERHRMIRAPLERFFSRKAILEMEDIVKEKADKLCRRVGHNSEDGKPTNIGAGFRAVSIDVITSYAFDNCWNHLDEPDFGDWYTEAVRGTSIMWYNFQQFPFLTKPMMSMPQRLGRAMDPMMGDWFDCINRTTSYAMGVKRDHENGIKPTRRTIFHDLLDSGVGFSDQALAGEALGFCNAAAETAGSAMEMAAYQVTTNPHIYKRLREELCQAFPDPRDITYPVLEKLPYLTGVIKEALRLSMGVTGRLARGTPEPGATFQGYYVPPKTTVSMSAWILHRDPASWDHPDTFDPTRWLDPSKRPYLEKRMVSFGRGSRACLGQNLAMCEMFIVVGTLFRRFENLQAVDITPADMEYIDHFSAFRRKKARPFEVIDPLKA